MTDVALVTTWDVPCGIAEMGAYWLEATTAADPSLRVEVVSDLHPRALLDRQKLPAVIVLNFQAALLSQWHPEHIIEAEKRGGRVLTIYHDSGVPNSDQCKGICTASDYFVLHEPFMDLPAHGEFMRQGIPRWQGRVVYNWGGPLGPRPLVGTVGFPSGYKNYDLLCEASALAGWGVVLIAPNATADQVATWQRLNPACEIHTTFMDRQLVVSHLAGCDATAFLYSTNANGTSGAIRQGIAARKPVLALRSRQFRDLEDEDAIQWIDNGSPDGIAEMLELTPSVRLDHGIVRLAEQDSWTRKGRRYAEIIKGLL